MSRYRAIVMGVSAGGFKALSTVLPKLQPSLPLPVLIVQHLSPVSDTYLVDHLKRLCAVKVKMAEDKEPAEAGVVYLAPPDYHLLVEADNSLALSLENRVNYSRPSIDVLFSSAAEVYLEGLIGVIMTGANSDGAEGLARIKECGGLAVVQAPETAEVNVMPLAAMEVVAVDYVVPLERLGRFLNSLAMGQ